MFASVYQYSMLLLGYQFRTASVPLSKSETSFAPRNQKLVLSEVTLSLYTVFELSYKPDLCVIVVVFVYLRKRPPAIE